MAKSNDQAPPRNADLPPRPGTPPGGKGSHTFRSAASGHFFTKHAPGVSITRVERAFERASDKTGAFLPKTKK